MQPEIAVYTQGKTGSNTLVEVLRGLFPARRIWDVKRALPEGVREHESIRGRRPALLSDDVEFAKLLQRQILIDLKLVCTVREPVGTAVSSFFYNFGPRNPGLDLNKLSDGEIIRRLVAGESFSHPSFHLEWFDIEVKLMTGIDVYQEPFPSGLGYASYYGTNFGRRSNLLVMRLEDLGQVGHVALSRFFGRQVAPIKTRVNDGGSTDYAERYAAFKRDAALPADWVDWQLDSRYARHFYTSDERDMLRRSWCKVGG